MSEKRFNIGILVANIMDSFSNRVSKGAIAAAEALDANLVIFPMKYLDVDYDNASFDMKFEYQYHILMDHAAKAGLDYLIVCSGTIAYISDDARKKEMLDYLSDTPILNVASRIEGYDYLIYDNASGITQAVNYLAQKQHRKHICMMIGRLVNLECRERFEAYRAALAANGLEFSDRMVIESDISEFCTNEASLLLDNNPECDAVVCVNDEMAAVFYKLLRERGKLVGRDIMLVGFDDSTFAAKMDPPLASVRADAYSMGYRAVERVVNILNGINDDNSLCMTEFVPRASCSAESLLLNSMDNVFAGSDDAIAGNIVNYIHQGNITADYLNIIKPFCRGIIAQLRTTLIENKAQEGCFGLISGVIEEFLSRNRIDADLVPRVIEAVDGGHKWLLGSAPEENSHIINRLFKYAVIKISNGMISDFKNFEDSSKNHTHLSNLFTRDTLMFDENMAMSYARMMNKFYCLDIRSSYLFLFDKPAEYRCNGAFPSDIEWRFMSHQHGKSFFMVPAEERSVTAGYMYRNKYIPDGERHTFIVADLYSREYQYGILLCEPDTDAFFADLELVVYQVSTAVKLIRLISEQDRINEKLHMKNIALENLSEIDELTGIYNRRGFYRAAEEFIGKNTGSEIIVCYADMDGLKQVNDGYGHSEGDFSIKNLARCLVEIFGDNGIVGRMGGDEFAALALTDEVSGTESILAKKTACIEHLNRTANKPYTIDMSMGFCECRCENSYDLKEAVDKADGRLYDDKTERKRRNSARQK
ncbi:MAG: diguanylate cyclase domain-containing protein [Oscillospiraceae bacterium]